MPQQGPQFWDCVALWGGDPNSENVLSWDYLRIQGYMGPFVVPKSGLKKEAHLILGLYKPGMALPSSTP